VARGKVEKSQGFSIAETLRSFPLAASGPLKRSHSAAGIAHSVGISLPDRIEWSVVAAKVCLAFVSAVEFGRGIRFQFSC